MTNKIKVLYHTKSKTKLCLDGFTAAWAAWTVLKDTADYIPVMYGNPVPNCINPGDTVYILDFSYSRSQIDKLKTVADSVIILDHHKTAKEALLGVSGAIFNMNKSGAALAWEYWHPNCYVPDLVRYIQDRDLWRFDLPNSKAIHKALEEEEATFENYERLANLPNFVETMSKIGIPLMEEHSRKIKQAADNYQVVSYTNSDKMYAVGYLNSSYLESNDVGASDTLNFICQENRRLAFAATSFFDGKNYTYSFRSLGDFDVSEIAKSYSGGGGHRNAAGCKTTNFIFNNVFKSRLEYNGELLVPDIYGVPCDVYAFLPSVHEERSNAGHSSPPLPDS